MDTISALQYYRDGEIESTNSAIEFGEILESSTEIVTYLALINSDSGDIVVYNDETYGILNVIGVRSSQNDAQDGYVVCGTGLIDNINIPSEYSSKFDSDYVDCCVAQWKSNLYDKSQDDLINFQTPYVMIDIENSLESQEFDSNRRRLVDDIGNRNSKQFQSNLKTFWQSKVSIKSKLESDIKNNKEESGKRRKLILDDTEDETELTDVCNPILFTMTYSIPAFFNGLEAVKNCHFPQCSYWDEIELDWSTDGCYVASRTNDSFTCACNHLTYFAGSWEEWCPQVNIKTDYEWILPYSTDNIGDYPAATIWIVILAFLYSIVLCITKSKDDKPLLAIKHSVLTTFAKKRHGLSQAGAERLILQRMELDTFQKAKLLFKLNIFNDHLLLGIWFRKAHTNLSSQARVAVFFTLLTGILIVYITCVCDMNAYITYLYFCFVLFYSYYCHKCNVLWIVK